MDAITALETYRNRDLAEKAFGNLKDKLNLRRALASSEQGLNGKLFVSFVALIYLSYIKQQMQTNNVYSNYTMQQVFDKLDVIECFENPGDALRVGEVLKKQRDLYVSLGVEPPTPYEDSSL
ncbi:MAG: transposase [Lachnospiraceae bacterium]|nr:transposase [Lachnospiraceae bacterium]